MLVSAQTTNADGHWVTAWSTAVHASLSFPGVPAPTGFENQTIRMVVRTSVAGERLRVRFSNELGTTPLIIGSAHIAVVKENSAVVADTDRTLKFGGEM